eukprot:GHVR01084301.1.p1 GENE.GHVR01084301.1~~GHVR01084301.1.p1  ORF type:complete len:304 (+),score=44.13 GHVR01084301.1:628-1539(+)
MKVQTPKNEVQVTRFEQETHVMQVITERNFPFFNYFLGNYYCPRSMISSSKEVLELKGFACTLLQYAHNGNIFDRKYQLFNHFKTQKKGYYHFAQFIYKWTMQILTGLYYLHQADIIHHDIKDENIFLDENDNVMIGDFGFSLQTIDNRGQSDFGGGTVDYTAPEIVAKFHIHNNKVDIFALGVMLWESCTLEFYTNNVRPWAVEEVKNKRVNFKRSDYELCEKYWFNEIDNKPINIHVLVSSMLMFDPNDRLSARDLLTLMGTTPWNVACMYGRNLECENNNNIENRNYVRKYEKYVYETNF